MNTTTVESKASKATQERGEVTVADRSNSDMESQEQKGEVLDAFGDESNAEIKYKTMSWQQGAAVMLAENISLGILSLPGVIAKVGLVGGLIAIVGLGLFSTYSGYVLWQFRMRFPQCANYGDIGEILLGRFGKEFFGAAYVIYCVFCMASHLLTFTIALNVLTSHASCTIVWGIIGLVVFSLLSVPRTLKGISFLSCISFLSIFSAVMLTIIALGIHPQAAYDEMRASYSPYFPTAFNSVSNVVFAYAGHVAWISFISELRKPEDFPKALMLQQGVDIVLYTVASLVIYRYAGESVKSPALSTNTHTVKLVAWGIALPTIVIAGVIFAHVTAKYAFMRIFANTPTLHSNGWYSWAVWMSILVAMWAVALVIAESIPVFSDLLGFISALFASWFSYGVPGICWFYLNKDNGAWKRSWKMKSLSALNLMLILLAFVICFVGLYASGWSMAHAGTHASAWSCADNSG